MKHPWLSALLFLGLTLVVRSKEAETNHLQEIQHSKGRAGTEIANAVVDKVGQVTNTVSGVVAGTPLADPFSAFLLFIGNILGFFNNLDVNNANLGTLDLANIDLANLGIGAAGTAAGGAAAVFATAIAALSSFKTGLLTVGVKGLEIANFILAIIGLALLGAYAYVHEGDIKGIFETGTGYASGTGYEEYEYPHDSYSSYVSSARALLDTPVVQRLATAVQDAITKYQEDLEEKESEAE
ncbi:uncharacterized protein [Macrobrachium rosenbergii]|uniref:uncharacterized protein n=1 Tax=Macrobrachium rosenbergii TaxID=79674 RepID=UPI0034D66811